MLWYPWPDLQHRSANDPGSRSLGPKGFGYLDPQTLRVRLQDLMTVFRGFRFSELSGLVEGFGLFTRCAGLRRLFASFVLLFAYVLGPISRAPYCYLGGLPLEGQWRQGQKVKILCTVASATRTTLTLNIPLRGTASAVACLKTNCDVI